jgi:thiamine pyrophosphate-dependent acetolactate synthase large subunit-like protein
VSVRRFGSDLVVDFLDAAGITHVALNPGASFRGLHDSIAAAGKPEIIVALHEEIAVALAHGYAKSAGRPMAVFLHDQVGLQHAAMALFNAFVDGVPMLVIGGTGPRDTTHRRPWVDWIHSGHPDAAVIRDVVKWDDEPVSLGALGHSLARGLRIATTPPMGPVYIGIDALLQEQDAEGVARYVVPAPVPPVTAPRAAIEDMARALAAAEHPAIVVDRGAPGLSRPLRALAEHLGIAVVDLGGRSVPSDHWADRTTAWEQVLAEADLVLAIELRDVAWGLTRVDVSDRSTVDLTAPGARIVAIGLTELRHRGYVQLEGLSPGVERLTGEATTVISELYDAVLAHGIDSAAAATRRGALTAAHTAAREEDQRLAHEARDVRPIIPAHLAASLGQAIGEDGWQLANGLLGNWPRRLWKTRDETTYLGRSGGEGLGYGLPASIGAALAQRGSGQLVVDVQSDGDLLYTPQALWTAAHHELPLLIVVHNNRTYGKDELHQAEIARTRGRLDYEVPPRGIRIEAPALDYAALARAQGVEGIGPVEDPAELAEVLERAAEVVRSEHRPVLVDVVCSGDLNMSGTAIRGASTPHEERRNKEERWQSSIGVSS